LSTLNLSLEGHTSKSHAACGLLGLHSDAFIHQICPPAFRRSKHLAEEEKPRAAAWRLFHRHYRLPLLSSPIAAEITFIFGGIFCHAKKVKGMHSSRQFFPHLRLRLWFAHLI
jgi:hypothetical protein